MGVFTKHGFYSAVCAREVNRKHWQPVDPSRMMVRARVRAHLEALRQRYPDVLASCETREFPGTEYAFRLFVAKSVWAQLMSALAEEIVYDNLKSAAARHQGAAGNAYKHALSQVWE